MDANNAWANSLTPAEEAAVNNWKSSPKSIRKSIAVGKPTANAKAIVKALEKSVPHAGMVYRGLHGSYVSRVIAKVEAAGVGGEWEDVSPTGYSLNPSAAHSFGGGQFMWRVAARTIRPIIKAGGFSDMSPTGETECLSMPGTRFRIIAIHKGVKVRDEKNSHEWTYGCIVDLEEIHDA